MEENSTIIKRYSSCVVMVIYVALIFGGTVAAQDWTEFGSEEIIRAGTEEIVVPGYSVPSYTDWNNDGVPDLIAGQGSGTESAKVRIYLNYGEAGAPVFSNYFYAKSNSSDLLVAGSGCLGIFPRLADWNGDGRKDLLAGIGGGAVRIYLNTGTNSEPFFDGGSALKAGLPGYKVDINTGSRPTPSVTDWNNDGKKDIIMGNYDGKVYIFINEGTDTEPDFRQEMLARVGTEVLTVPSGRSSPSVCDLNRDGKKDLICGNTNGELLYYENTNTDSAAVFREYAVLTSNGEPIDLPGTPRTRPQACDWTGDYITDIVTGAGDGKIHVYPGIPEPVIHLMTAGIFLIFRQLIRIITNRQE